MISSYFEGMPFHVPLKTYGRRKARQLSINKQQLLEKHLVNLTLDISQFKGKIDPSRLFSFLPEKVFLEIGFGSGEHLIHQALQNPKIGLLGAEVFINGIASLVKKIVSYNLNNIYIYPDDVRKIFSYFMPHMIDRIYVFFPDPWPKTRHHSRRFLTIENLNHLSYLMKNNAELHLASDNISYINWVYQQINKHNNFSMLNETVITGLNSDSLFKTRYATKALEKGEIIKYLIVRHQID